jgi:hypothetical protein
MITLRQIFRLYLPFWIFMYCACFHWAYAYWVTADWWYMGLTYRAPNWVLLGLAYALPMMMTAVSPRTLTRPSQVMFWFVFLSVYVPGLFVPIFVQLDGSLTLLLMQLNLTAGMILIAAFYKLPLARLRWSIPLRPGFFWSLFGLFYLALMAVTLFAYRNNLHFATVKEIYDVRFAGRQVAEKYPGLTYVTAALETGFNPLLCAYGWNKRKKFAWLLGCAGQVLLYMTSAQKSVLLSIPLIYVFIVTLRKDRGAWITSLVLVSASITWLFPFLALMLHDSGVGAVAGVLAGATVIRSAALPGMFLATYQYFFEQYPHTYLSHLNVVGLFLHNPYELSLGQETGIFFYGWSGPRGVANANANFFAMDGIGGFGLYGLPLMGAVCGLWFWFLDSCVRKYSIPFVASGLVMAMISLTNASLFSALLGGGFSVWMVIFLFAPESFRSDTCQYERRYSPR